MRDATTIKVATLVAVAVVVGVGVVARHSTLASNRAPAANPAITETAGAAMSNAAPGPEPARNGASPFGDPPRSALARRGWDIAVSGNPNLSTPCSVCHGVDGSGRRAAGIPQLAGQETTYLVKQLQDFQAGRREHFTMQPVAAALSVSDIDAVAAYYSTLPAPKPAPGMYETRTLALGTWIADKGISERGVPSCTSCHGKDGVGVPPIFPRLQGQSAAYIKRQFHDMRKGHRQNDPGGLMRIVAGQLTEEEIRSVAAYFEYLGEAPAGSLATD